MHKRKICRQHNILHLAVAGALVMTSVCARADGFGEQLAAGAADHDVKKGDLGIVWDPGLTWWEIGGYHFTVVGEAHAADMTFHVNCNAQGFRFFHKRINFLRAT